MFERHLLQAPEPYAALKKPDAHAEQLPPAGPV